MPSLSPVRAQPSAPEQPTHALEAAEARALADERRVSHAIEGLEARRAELSQRLEALRRDAARVPPEGRFAEVVGVQQRLAATVLPELELGATWQSAVEARRAAVLARNEVNREASEAVRLWAESFEVLERLVKADEVTVAEARAAASRAQVAARQAPAPQADSPAPRVQAPEGRRKATRAPLRTAVDLSTESNFFTGFTGDISVGGVFVATFAPVALGEELTLELTLPTGAKLMLEGQVKWTREYNDFSPDTMPGAGVEFRAPPPEAIAAIQEFLTQREPLFFPD